MEPASNLGIGREKIEEVRFCLVPKLESTIFTIGRIAIPGILEMFGEREHCCCDARGSNNPSNKQSDRGILRLVSLTRSGKIRDTAGSTTRWKDLCADIRLTQSPGLPPWQTDALRFGLAITVNRGGFQGVH